MAIYPDDTRLSDFLLDTLPTFLKRKWQDLSQTRQETVYGSRVIQQSGIKGGPDLRWRVQTTHTASHRHRGINATEVAQPESQMAGAIVDWASASVGRAWSEEEFDFNAADENQIVDEMAHTIHGMWEDLINGEETDLWTAPASSTENPRRPSGIPFWAQKASTTTSAFGFNGGDPSGFSSGAANLATASIPGWKNPNFGYSTVSNGDLLPKMGEMIEKTYFKPPRAYPEVVDQKPNFVIYTTYKVLEQFQLLQTTANDNLGMDVGKYRGNVMFKGIPMTWVPCLSNSGDAAVDTQNPIYFIDWSKFKYFFKTGWNWREMPIQTPPDQPTARKLWLINWGNYACYDRRQIGVGHTTVFGQ